jgi:CRP-like cAMP-binding protein
MLDQSELLMGMGKLFFRSFNDLAVKTTHRKGGTVFWEGAPALYYYTMVSGRVSLFIKTGFNVYSIDTPGEVFGWSTLVDRPTYSATAECVEPTTLLRFDKNDLVKMLEEHPQCSITFYKNIAKTLGNRLLTCYSFISGALSPT